jgi:hypothetical protein
MKLQQYTDQALDEFNQGQNGVELTPAMKRQIRNDPTSRNRWVGTVIDKRVKELVEQDSDLNKKLFYADNGQYGPDWLRVDIGRPPGAPGWYDLTTQQDWASGNKQRKYDNVLPNSMQKDPRKTKLGTGVAIVWDADPGTPA